MDIRFPKNIQTSDIKLPDGRTVHLFVNLKDALIVLDVVDASEEGGVELVRAIVEGHPYQGKRYSLVPATREYREDND